MFVMQTGFNVFIKIMYFICIAITVKHIHPKKIFDF